MRLDSNERYTPVRGRRASRWIGAGLIIPILLTVTTALAAFYEVAGTIRWDGKPLKNVRVYLLREDYQRVRTETVGNQDILILEEQSFSNEFNTLQKEIDQLEDIGGRALKRRAVRPLRKRINSLIEEHKVRRVPYRDGRFRVSIAPSTDYYIFAVKRPALFSRDQPFLYWKETVRFPPGETETPLLLSFSEENAKRL